MIHLGTTNPSKIAEFAAILTPLGLDFTPISLDVPETGVTFVENARIKALAYAAHTKGVVVCEDSGIAVAALNGLPGPWSARFDDCVIENHRVVDIIESHRPRDIIDAANNVRLLSMLEGVAQPYRAAEFEVCLVVATPDRILYEVSRSVAGWISKEARGSKGFGYDPIFIGNDTFGLTYAEMDPVRKNLRSHRKQALADFGYWIALAFREGSL